jgi:nucleoside-diphosphate-sugar epimerase
MGAALHLGPFRRKLARVSNVFVTGGSGFVGGALVSRLVGDGHSVRALARTEKKASELEQIGALAVPGDLDDLDALRAGAAGCDLVFHSAALVSDWAPKQAFEHVNVTGTGNVLAACAAAGAGRLVHLSSESVLLSGRPLRNADESWPLQPRSRNLYAGSKARAELLVRAATGLETVIVRPVIVWGTGDRTIRPGFAAAVREGRFVWVDGGRHLTSTTHVDNAVHGILLAAERGRTGEAYSISDGEPIAFREFLTPLLATAGVTPPERSIPLGLARAVAAAGEAAWRTLRLRGRPPLTRTATWLVGIDRTIDIGKARRELGYEPVRTRADGLAELQAAG